MDTAQNTSQDINHSPSLGTAIITVNTWLSWYRLRNFYLTNSFQGFVWMVFHFSVIFFFTFLLKEVALVGLFLWFANLIAFFIDIPLGVIQRYISTKRMFIIGAISQLIAVGIFFVFIFKFFTILQYVGWTITPDSLKSWSDWFFWSAINWIWVFIASICYGVTKEINDVSTYGYVLSQSNPSEYGTILARNNITFWVGSLMGLLVSWIILSLSPGFAVIILWIIIMGFLSFIIKFFDNSVDSVSFDDIQDFRVSVQKWNNENIREYVTETIKKTDIQSIISKTKYLMIKPKQKNESEKISWKEVRDSGKKEFGTIWKIFSHNPLYVNLIWTITLILIFWFWDTFASSFLLSFLDDVKPGWSYVLLAIIGVPGIALQEFASKLGQKIGLKAIGIIWLCLSSTSLMILGLLALGNPGPGIIIGVALINSLWYACGMSTGQNQFLDTYNQLYAKEQNLTEINANASSGPMKVVQNLANVIGLVFGGILLMFWFPAFFFIFWIIIFGILIWTIIHNDKIIL